MNIAYISTIRIPSTRANSIQVMKVCQALTQLGHAVTLFVPNSGQSPVPGLQALMEHYGLHQSFTIEWLNVPSRRLFLWMAVRRACTLGFELLYTRSLPAAVYGLIHHLPVILELHELPAGYFGPFWYRLFSVLPGKKRLFPLTKALRTLLTERYPWRLVGGEIQVAPSGVDLERFENLPDPSTTRRQIGLPPAPTVVCTGNLYSGRGMELFLELAAREPAIQFLWVGGNLSDVTHWRDYVSAQNLGNVTFTGFIANRDVPSYQASADVLVLPYQSSVAGSSGGDIAGVFSPLKMFEYMATGRPILCSDLPVLREILSEEMAVFCPPTDVNAWQEALSRLLFDREFSTSLSKAARMEAAKYSWLERTRRILASLTMR